jgi:hypothetical protein
MVPFLVETCIFAFPTTFATSVLWGPWLTTRDSRYAYNSRSQETVVNPHNRVGISDYNIHYIISIKVLHKPLG